MRTSNGQVFRFMNAAPSNIFQRHDQNFYNIASSFRTISSREAAQIKLYYVRYRTIRRGDTIASLSALLPFKNNRETIFRSLNGFASQQKLPTSGHVKIISIK